MRRLALVFIAFGLLLPARVEAFEATLVSIKPGEWLSVYRTPSTRHPLRDGRKALYVTGRYWILERRGEWAGISSIARHDNRLTWVRLGEEESGVFSLVETTRRAVVDLSDRTVRVELDGRTVYRARVAVGRPSAPTPTGQTSVEAIWRPGQLELPSSYYGSWIMQFGLWQRHSSPGFPNGGATAFHGTPSPSDRGRAVSAGCIRLLHGDLIGLRRHIMVGTPVIVRR